MPVNREKFGILRMWAFSTHVLSAGSEPPRWWSRKMMRAMDTDAPSPALNREYAGEAATLRAARHDVVDFLTECGADDQTVERASLITSELASNAIQAAPGTFYQLAVRIVDPNAVSLSVRNRSAHGTFPPPKANWRPVDELAIRGRGLAIVESLTDEVSVVVEGNEVTVTTWFRLVAP